MAKKWLVLLAVLSMMLIVACTGGDEEDDEPEATNTQTNQQETREAAFAQATLDQEATFIALTPSNTPTNTPTATRTATLTRTPTITRTPTDTPSNTPTATDTATPTDTASPTDTATSTFTPDVPGTIDAAVLATLTAQPTATSTDTPTDTATPTDTNTPLPTEPPLQVMDYQALYAPGLQLGFVAPTGWTANTDGSTAMILSPERTSGIIVQRGTRATLISLGLLGRDTDLSVALQNVALAEQAGEVTEINQVPVDVFGVPTLKLRAEDISTITLAYLMSLNGDDYVLVVAYSPLAESMVFEQQVVVPLLVSLDKVGSDTIMPGAAETEAAQASPTIPPTEAAAPATTAPTALPTEESVTAVPTTANTPPPAATEVGQGSSDDLQFYSSLGLQLTFSYPPDATVEADGPVVFARSNEDEQARVVFIRLTPQEYLEAEFFTDISSPEAALAELAVESLGQELPVEQVEMFGFPTYQVLVDFIPDVYIVYYLVDLGPEWLYILAVAPLEDQDFKTSLVDPILNSLQITPPVVEATPVFVEFDTTYTSETTGITAGVFTDTQVTDEPGKTTFVFENGTITIWRGAPGDLMAQGLIPSDIGLISALRGIASAAGFPDVTVEPDRYLRFDQAAYVEFVQDGVGYRYLGAVVKDGDWMIMEVRSEDFEAFKLNVLPSFMENLDVADEFMPGSGSGESNATPAPTAANNDSGETPQPTYTPLPTYTPMPTYTQPAPG